MSSESPIDTSEIEIEIVEEGQNDHRLSCTIPSRLVLQIREKLKAGGLEQTDQQLANLMAKICIEEGQNRLGSDSIWGATPLTDAPPQLKEGEPFKVAFMVDSLVDFTHPDWKTIEVIRPICDIDDAAIEEEMIQQCNQVGSRTSSQDGLAEGDEFVANLQMWGAEAPRVPLMHAVKCVMRIPEPGKPLMVNNIPLDKIAPQLIGHKAGDTVTCSAPSPDLLSMILPPGSPAEATIEILETSRITPATVDEVVSHYGTPNETILRQQIRLSLKNRAESEQEFSLIQQFFNAALDVVDIPVPQRIIEKNASVTFANIKQNLTAAKIDEAEQDLIIEKHRASIMNRIERNLRKHALALHLRKEVNISISERQINDHINFLAQSQNRRPEDLRNELVKSGAISKISVQLLENQVAEKMLEKVRIKDMPIAEFNSMNESSES